MKGMKEMGMLTKNNSFWPRRMASAMAAIASASHRSHPPPPSPPLPSPPSQYTGTRAVPKYEAARAYPSEVGCEKASSALGTVYAYTACSLAASRRAEPTPARRCDE